LHFEQQLDCFLLKVGELIESISNISTSESFSFDIDVFLEDDSSELDSTALIMELTTIQNLVRHLINTGSASSSIFKKLKDDVALMSLKVNDFLSLASALPTVSVEVLSSREGILRGFFDDARYIATLLKSYSEDIFFSIFCVNKEQAGDGEGEFALP